MTYSPLELAQAFIKTGELDDALAALNQHLADEPDDDGSRRLRAHVLIRLPGDEHLRAALTDFDSLTERTTDDDIRCSIALERLGDLNEAVRVMRNVCHHDVGNERLTERLVQLLIARQDWDEANRIVDSMPRTWRWLQWSGDLAVYVDDDRRAVMRYGLALAQIETRFDLTTDQWGQAIKARLLLARANAYRRLNQLEQAAADYDTAAQYVPDDPMLPLYRGMLAALHGHIDEAVELCGHALATANPLLRADMIATLQSDKRLEPLINRLDLDPST